LEILRHSSGDPISPNLSVVLQPSLKPEAPRLDLEDFYCILQIQPNDSFMACELSRRLERLGRWDEAAKILRSVLKIDYRFATVFAFAQLQYKREQWDEALQLFHAALAIAPDSCPEFFELFKTLGNICVRKGDLDAAEDNYNKAHRLNSSSDVLLVNFAALHMQRSQWDEALQKYRAALELNARNDKAWVGLALGHRLRGDLELAWGNLELAVEINPLNEVALGLVVEWGLQGQHEARVLELVRQFIVRGGWDEKLSLVFAWLCCKRGERNLAFLELERLLSMNPAYGPAQSLLAEMKSK
jgi:tetratricopeptide (TPR) repeat protein